MAAQRAVWADDLCTEPVMTESGLVRGMSEPGGATCVWQGIPYAAPPLGELRWKAPKPHSGWAGVRAGSEFGNICMQDPAPLAKIINIITGKKVKQSEDCLYLNIWSPAKSGRLPVMFWIHGGGYQGGSGSSPVYNGNRLAEFGEVVVVTINYRLGVFGFLAHPELKNEDPNGGVGGYGILDMVAALEWVQDNIEGFGGDPENVTIFGESAGAWATCTLMATPLANGLFHRAIMESQGCQACVTLEEGYEQAADISEALGCNTNDINCLRQVPGDKLLKTTADTVEGIYNMMPNIDGYLLTDTPLAMIESGDYNKVPLLAGHNRNETDLLVLFMPKLYGKRAKDYKNIRIKSIPLEEAEARELTELYPLSAHQGKVKKAYGQILSDALISCPTYSAVAAVSRQQKEVYYYRFDYDDMRYGKIIRAAHSMEIPFVFNALDRYPSRLLYGRKRMPEARALSKNIQGYWANFARTGNPNGDGLPHWPRYSRHQPITLILDTKINTQTADCDHKCEFWLRYNKNHVLPVRSLGK